MHSDKDLWKKNYFASFNPRKTISERTVATMLDCSLRRIKQARILGLTPAFREYKGKIYYSQIDIHIWIAQLNKDYINHTNPNRQSNAPK